MECSTRLGPNFWLHSYHFSCLQCISDALRSIVLDKSGKTDAEVQGVGAMSWADGVRQSSNLRVHLVACEALKCSPRF
jgi:hypothetical protein